VAYAKGSSYSVPVDIYETDTHLVIVAGPLYRVKAETLDISVNGDMLTLQGETEPETDVPEEAYLKRERRAGHFKRTLRLPTGVDANNTRAQLKQDILKILLPKTASSE
jgi:HSP20 family protein